MGGVGSAKLWLAWRRIGFQIAADITSRETLRTQAGKLKVREILANSAARIEHIGHRAGDRGCSGIEREIFMNAPSEVVDGIEDWPFGCERNFGIVEKLIPDWNEG
jgi:hypothetical protein